MARETTQTFCQIGRPWIGPILHWNHASSLMARDTTQTRRLPLYKRCTKPVQNNHNSLSRGAACRMPHIPTYLTQPKNRHNHHNSTAMTCPASLVLPTLSLERAPNQCPGCVLAVGRGCKASGKRSIQSGRTSCTKRKYTIVIHQKSDSRH